MDFELFLTHMTSLKNCSDMTLRAYRSDLEFFHRFSKQRGVKRITQIDLALISAYVEHMEQVENPRFRRKGLSKASIARRLAAVSSCIEFHRATKDPKLRNPLKEVRRKWKKNDEPKPIEEYTIDLFLASITNLRDRALFSLMLASGFRVSEVHQLNVDSIRMEVETLPTGDEREIGWGEVVGKGGKRRKFYVDGATLNILAEYLVSRRDNISALFLSERKQRLSVRSIQYTMNAWCKKLGFSHHNVHRLRHTFATRLANAGIPLMILKDLMGHNSPVTTTKYFKLTDQTLARSYFAAMEQFNR